LGSHAIFQLCVIPKWWAIWKGTNKAKLKLRVTTRSCNPQKLVEAISSLCKHNGLAFKIPHVKGEKVFGSCKRRMDLPPSLSMDSHRLDCVNFSMPKEGGQVVKGKTNAFVPFANIDKSLSGSLKVFSRNGKKILEILEVHSLEDVRFLLEEKN
jgi:hypothetical protein